MIEGIVVILIMILFVYLTIEMAEFSFFAKGTDEFRVIKKGEYFFIQRKFWKPYGYFWLYLDSYSVSDLFSKHYILNRNTNSPVHFNSKRRSIQELTERIDYHKKSTKGDVVVYTYKHQAPLLKQQEERLQLTSKMIKAHNDGDEALEQKLFNQLLKIELNE